MSWIRHSLNRQLLAYLCAGLIFSSFLCLLLFVKLYHTQLAEERSSASIAVNRLLQTSLENAMLKQDLDGLRDIVRRLGKQDDIQQVFIANPHGEIRFASDARLLGRRLSWSTPPRQEQTQFLDGEDGEVLRSINPVRNKPVCTRCHGPLEQKPVNGVLFVDYIAAPIRAKARATTALFVGAGIVIITLTLLTLWLFIHRLVLQPVQRLARAGQALADGDLDARVSIASANELGQLSAVFNQMAETLQIKMRKLNEQEAFLQGLLDAIPDGIRVLNQDYQVVKANHAYCRQLALNSEKALRQPCYAVYQRDKPCVPTLSTCPLHEIPKQNTAIKKLTHYLDANDAEHPVEVYAAPLEVIIDGQAKRLIVESIRDLDRLVQFSHEQKLAAMGQVAVGVAHEIHNPLASLHLALQSMLRSLAAGTEDTEQLRDYLHLVDREIDKCVAVTHRLLKLTTLGGGQRQLMEVETALRETLSLLDYESRERAVHIDIEVKTPGCRILAQENDIRMIFINLAQNAFHAMPQGGELRVVLERAAGTIRVHFYDNGLGIAPEHLSKIFDPFFSYRADGEKGTGLGLSICKTLAEQYQGGIQVYSRLGEGARFTLCLLDADQQLADTEQHDPR